MDSGHNSVPTRLERTVTLMQLIGRLPTRSYFGLHAFSAAEETRTKRYWIRAYKCGISTDLYTFQELLLHDSGAMLFRKMQSSTHCLKTLLPPKKTIDYVLRNSDTSYVLPQCSLSVFKRSFINWYLFTL